MKSDGNMTGRVREFAAQRKYGAATLERWLALTDADAAALLGVARPLRLGENQLRGLWEWAQDIARRDGSSVDAVLSGESVTAVLRSGLGRNDKLKRIRAHLRRLRFPQLCAAEERLLDLLRSLDLPRDVSVRLPEFLEGDELHVAIVARDAASLRRAAARLQAAADTPACAEIFALLGEAP
jgi:hypothetical protein